MDKREIEIAKLREENRILREENQRLRERLEKLERMFNLNSANSSKPPSSDALRKKPSPQSLRVNGKKTSGGQDGHQGSTLTQVENPDLQVTHRVESCEACKQSLDMVESIDHVKRQVFDIVEPRIEITEHLAEIKICQCGRRNRALMPESVSAPVQYGPRVKAFIVYLANQQLIPEDRLQQIFGDLFSLKISTATIATINSDFADQITPIQEQTLENLKNAETKGVDESGLRIAGKTLWVHILCSAKLTHYRVSEKRGEILDGVRGILVHDHWKPYFTMTGVEHALCNAHHLRELEALKTIEREPWAFSMSRLLRLLCRLKNAPFERVSWLYDNIVEKGLVYHESQRKLSGRKRRPGHNLLLRLRDFKDAVLRFLTNPNVPFTNNQAEQDIRMIKVKQKISGSFRTVRGAQIFCIIRGFISTLRKQELPIFQTILANY